MPGTRQAGVIDTGAQCVDLFCFQFDAAPTRHVARHGKTQEPRTHQATHINADGSQRRTEVARAGATRGDVKPRIGPLARVGATLQDFERRIASSRCRSKARQFSFIR